MRCLVVLLIGGLLAFIGAQEIWTPCRSLYVMGFSNTINTMACGELFCEDVTPTEDFSQEINSVSLVK